MNENNAPIHVLHDLSEASMTRAIEETMPLFQEVHAYLGLGPDLPWRYYLGTFQGKPIATALLFFAAGVAALHSVVTLPEARYKGIGTAMTLAALREARREGYRVAILTASPYGVRIYRRIGFREYCTISRYNQGYAVKKLDGHATQKCIVWTGNKHWRDLSFRFEPYMRELLFMVHCLVQFSISKGERWNLSTQLHHCSRKTSGYSDGIPCLASSPFGPAAAGVL